MRSSEATTHPLFVGIGGSGLGEMRSARHSRFGCAAPLSPCGSLGGIVTACSCAASFFAIIGPSIQ